MSLHNPELDMDVDQEPQENQVVPSGSNGSVIPVFMQRGLASMVMGSFKVYNEALIQQLEANNKELVKSLHRSLSDVASDVQNKIKSVQERMEDLARENAEMKDAVAQVRNKLSDVHEDVMYPDPFGASWNAADNIRLRQLFSWILCFGLDTGGRFGMAPLIQFGYYKPDGVKLQHMTLFHAGMFPLMYFHADQFKESLPENHSTFASELLARLITFFR